MKNIFAALAVISLLFLSACEQKNTDTDRDTTMDNTQTDNTRLDADTSRRVGIYWDENKTYTYNEKNQYKRDLNAALARLDKKIDSLEAKERVAKGEAREKYDKAITDLREKRKDVKDHAEKVDNVKEDEWDGFKNDVNSAWSSVEDTWNDMMGDLRDIDIDIGK